jgi:activating signal cointegrator complex subunit 1
MGKKKQVGEYNDFVDGEKLRDNGEIRTSLNGTSSFTQASSTPHARQDPKVGFNLVNVKGKGRGEPKKSPLTHFLCLPLVTPKSRPSLSTSLAQLKQDLAKNDICPPKAVRPPGTLHLTLGVMSLNDTDLEKTKQYLQNFKLHVLLRDLTMYLAAQRAAEDGTIAENLNAAGLPDTDALTVNLEGLRAMHEPHKTSILYAAPKDKTERLVAFAEGVKEGFEQEGWLKKDGRDLLLHATIINTIYAKDKGRRHAKPRDVEKKVLPQDERHEASDDNDENNNTSENINDVQARSQGHGPNAKAWIRFDARTLIEQYKDFTWAEDVRIDRVQICKMGAKKSWSGGAEGVGEVVDEEYEVVAEKGIFE